MSKKRITPEMVLEAYRKTNYIPIQNSFYHNDGNCACAIGAIYTMETGDRNEEEVQNYANKAFGVRYSHGFIAGFDGLKADSTTEDDYIDGYYDGKTVWKFIQGGSTNVNT